MRIFDWLNGNELKEVVRHNKQLPAQMAAKIKYLNNRATTTTNGRHKKALENTARKLEVRLRKLVSKN